MSHVEGLLISWFWAWRGTTDDSFPLSKPYDVRNLNAVRAFLLPHPSGDQRWDMHLNNKGKKRLFCVIRAAAIHTGIFGQVNRAVATPSSILIEVNYHFF